MQNIRLHYVFDPLCGWCYASALVLKELAQAWPTLLDLRPAGLFSGAGARELTQAWADYAWTNDKRIEAMTGQVFSEIYRRRVLLGSAVLFDSTMMNRALTAIQKISPALEPLLLHSLQVARYVEGRDTSRAAEVAWVATALLGSSGFKAKKVDFLHALETDSDLANSTEGRIRATQRMMKDWTVTGVPQLLISVEGRAEAFDSNTLYQGAGHVVNMLMASHGDMLPARM